MNGSVSPVDASAYDLGNLRLDGSQLAQNQNQQNQNQNQPDPYQMGHPQGMPPQSSQPMMAQYAQQPLVMQHHPQAYCNGGPPGYPLPDQVVYR